MAECVASYSQIRLRHGCISHFYSSKRRFSHPLLVTRQSALSSETECLVRVFVTIVDTLAQARARAHTPMHAHDPQNTHTLLLYGHTQNTHYYYTDTHYTHTQTHHQLHLISRKACDSQQYRGIGIRRHVYHLNFRETIFFSIIVVLPCLETLLRPED